MKIKDADGRYIVDLSTKNYRAAIPAMRELDEVKPIPFPDNRLAGGWGLSQIKAEALIIVTLIGALIAVLSWNP